MSEAQPITKRYMGLARIHREGTYLDRPLQITRTPPSQPRVEGVLSPPAPHASANYRRVF